MLKPVIVACNDCKKGTDKWALFSGGLCEKCYGKVFDRMSDQEKRPNFIKALNI